MARLLLIVLLSGGATATTSAFFTPPKGVIPSADDADAATPDRMVWSAPVPEIEFLERSRKVTLVRRPTCAHAIQRPRRLLSPRDTCVMRPALQ